MHGCQTRPVPPAAHQPAPRPPASDVRTDDGRRREVADALGQHLADGRLAMAEYEERLEATFAATTEADLRAVLADLPRIATAADLRRRRRIAQGMVRGWLGLCALFIAIWLLTGADYFWPVWPIMGTGIGTLPGAWATWRGAGGPAPA